MKRSPFTFASPPASDLVMASRLDLVGCTFVQKPPRGLGSGPTMSGMGEKQVQDQVAKTVTEMLRPRKKAAEDLAALAKQLDQVHNIRADARKKAQRILDQAENQITELHRDYKEQWKAALHYWNAAELTGAGFQRPSNARRRPKGPAQARGAEPRAPIAEHTDRPQQASA